jgi:hypothetical protein
MKSVCIPQLYGLIVWGCKKENDVPHILHRNDYEAAPGTSYSIWLILLAIHLTPGIFSAARVIVNHMHALDAGTWTYYLCVIGIALTALINFWQRKRITPWLLIAFLVTNLLFSLIYHAGGLLGEGEYPLYPLLRNALICILATPYLLLSRRVKAIFIK